MDSGSCPSTARRLALVMGVLSLAAAASPAAARDGPACIAPSGTDDTLVLQEALDRCAGARRRCVVRLCPGLFHTAQLRVRGFRGVLRGAGKEHTTLRSLPRLEVNENPWSYRDDPFDPALPPWPYLLQFFEGRAVIRDLRIEVPRTFEWSERAYELLGAILLTGRRPVDFTVKRVAIAGEESASHLDASLDSGVSCSGRVFDPDDVSPFPVHPFRGRCRVLDSDFAGVGVGLSFRKVDRGRITLARNHVRGGSGFSFYTLARTRVRIVENDWATYYGASIVPGFETTSSGGNTFRVHRNRGWASVHGRPFLFFDDEPDTGEGRSSMVVTGNDLTGWLAGALTIVGAEPLVVRSNTLRAWASSGVAINDTSGCRVSRNHLEDLRADVPVSQYWLGPLTEGCVVRVGLDDVVVDQGIDNRIIRR